MRMVVAASDAAREYAKDGNGVVASNLTIAGLPENVEFRLLPMTGFSRAVRGVVRELYGSERWLILVVSEVDTVWDAREWLKMPREDRFLLKQARKFGFDLFWDCQFTDQVEKGLRNMTDEVTLMQAIPAPTLRRRRRGKRPWFYLEQRFRPGAVRDLMGVKVDPDRRLGRSLVRYRRAWERLYDTDKILWPADEVFDAKKGSGSRGEPDPVPWS